MVMDTEDLVHGICCVVGFLTISSLIFFLARYYVEKSESFTYETVEVASIGLDSQIEGTYRKNFYYGYGYINEEMYYIVYEVFEDGGLFLTKIAADKTIVYDTLQEGETAYIEVKRNGFGHVVQYKLYVPEGSISREYDLSLSGL